MELRKYLSKYFRIAPGDDNLPIVAHPLPGRDHGRIQLSKLIGELGLRTGIEIGVGTGYSAALWCSGAPGMDLTGVDSYPAGMSRTKRHQDRYYARATKAAKKHGFKILKMASMEAVGLFEDESVDYLHVDGNHTFDVVVMDIVQYIPKVKKGGLIAIHDYCALKRGGVVQAVDAYTSAHRIDPWYVTRDCNPTAFWQRGAERA